MAANEYQDLNALLNTLSAYIPPPETAQSQQLQSHHLPQAIPLGDQGDHLQVTHGASSNCSCPPQQSITGAIQDIRSTSKRQFDNQIFAPNSAKNASPAANANLVQRQEADPGDITEWPIALRYITRLIAKDENIEHSIKKIIKNQQDNEMQWWADRESLLEKQKDRIEGKRKLDRVLLAVGGQLIAEHMTEDDNKREVEKFDLKVHKAARDMNHAISSELAALGIPFFGIRPYLIREEHREIDSEATVSKRCITRSELNTLKLQMIKFLEDMFK